MNTILNDIGYDAACMVVTRQEASVTSLMRLLDVNEDEAKQLMHKLNEAKVIGPVSEDGTAEVLITDFGKLAEITWILIHQGTLFQIKSRHYFPHESLSRPGRG